MKSKDRAETAEAGFSPTLKELQNWMRWVIVDPRGVDTALAKPIDQPEPACLLSIAEAPPLLRNQRLDIYAEAFFNRLKDSLADDFEALARLVGEEVFKRIAADYLAQHPSKSFTAATVGEKLPEFLKDYFLSKDIPYLPDLAKLEWHCIEAFYAKDAVRFDLTRLSQISESQWENVRFELDASVGLLKSDWDLATFWREQSDVIKTRASWLLIHRDDFQVFVAELTELEFLVLQAIRDGLTLGGICGRLEEHLSAAESTDDAPPIMQWFQRWLTNGVICSLIV